MAASLASLHSVCPPCTPCAHPSSFTRVPQVTYNVSGVRLRRHPFA